VSTGNLPLMMLGSSSRGFIRLSTFRCYTVLEAFRIKLQEVHDIKLSTAKIRKILITGGLWTTERSREIAALFNEFNSVDKVAAELGVTPELVTMYLPYKKVVYDLDEKSGHAKRAARWREKNVGKT